MSHASSSPLTPETLWERTVRTHHQALATGALQPIATECHLVPEAGVSFQVRVLGRAHLKERSRPQAPRATPVDPFEKPEPALVVGDVSPTHLCVLNKFNVVDHHLLIITRAFEAQESLLTAADFQALALCMAGVDGLAFYNSGATAGASQPHKHLQLVPPLGPEGLRAPLEAWLSSPPPPGRVGTVPAFHFAHALTGLSLKDAPPDVAATRLLEAYRALQQALDFGQPAPPYNLLATRDWMLLVPRTHTRAHGIDFNAMGFAGSLLVRTPEQLQLVRDRGPLAFLREVAPPGGLPD